MCVFMVIQREREEGEEEWEVKREEETHTDIEGSF